MIVLCSAAYFVRCIRVNSPAVCAGFGVGKRRPDAKRPAARVLFGRGLGRGGGNAESCHGRNGKWLILLWLLRTVGGGAGQALVPPHQTLAGFFCLGLAGAASKNWRGFGGGVPG